MKKNRIQCSFLFQERGKKKKSHRKKEAKDNKEKLFLTFFIRLKVAMEMVGYDAGVPRTPLLPANEQTKDVIKKIFVEAKILS